MGRATNLRTQNSELRTQNSELRAQNSELRAQSSGIWVFLLGHDLFSMVKWENNSIA